MNVERDAAQGTALRGGECRRRGKHGRHGIAAVSGLAGADSGLATRYWGVDVT